MSQQDMRELMAPGLISKLRRATAVFLAVTLIALGSAAANAPAHAANPVAHAAAQGTTQDAVYVSDEDGVTTETVQAIVLTPGYLRDETLNDGWYLCESSVQRSVIFVADGADEVNLILGDNCELSVINQIANPRRGAAIFVPQRSGIDIWSGVKNTGKLVATAAPGAAGIGGAGSAANDKPSSSGPVRIHGGIVIATGGTGAAGIGGGVYQASGGVGINWRASVLARGGAASENYLGSEGVIYEKGMRFGPGIAAGAGIGSGGSLRGSSNVVAKGGGLRVNTSGLVQAFGGAGTTDFAAGANIGTGGIGRLEGKSSLATVSVTKVAIGDGGAVQMQDVNQEFIDAAPISNVATRSTVTFRAVPAPGMAIERVAVKEDAATLIDRELFASEENLYPFQIPQQAMNHQLSFLFAASATLSAAQHTLTQRIAQLPDTISSVGEADEVAKISNLWRALPASEQSTMPALSRNRLQGAQQQAGLVNHAAPEAGIAIEGAGLDWNIRLLATNVAYDSTEFDTVRSSLAEDRLLIALADIRYIDSLSGVEVHPPNHAGVILLVNNLNLLAYEQIEVERQHNAGRAEAVAASVVSESLRIDGISAGRYVVTGNNVSDGGDGKGGAASDLPTGAIAGLTALLALGIGWLVSAGSMRRNIRVVGR